MKRHTNPPGAGLWLMMAFLLPAASCKTAKALKLAEDAEMMYAMVYDYENTPVSGVKVVVDGKPLIESDNQGRFILLLKKPGMYELLLTKSGYESITREIAYDPMKVLYFKMINAPQLVTLAEETLDEKRYADAEQILDRALRLDESRQDALFLKGITCYLEKKYGPARTIVERLLAVEGRKAYLEEFLAAIEETEGRAAP